MRDPSDPLYTADTLEINNELEAVLGQIRMLLFTKPGDVIGMLNFGIDLESKVFSTNVSNSMVENLVRSDIYAQCPLAESFNVDVKVSFFAGVSSDTCLIDKIGRAHV